MSEIDSMNYSNSNFATELCSLLLVANFVSFVLCCVISPLFIQDKLLQEMHIIGNRQMIIASMNYSNYNFAMKFYSPLLVVNFVVFVLCCVISPLFVQDRLLEEMHVLGKSIDDIADCLRGMPLHPSVVSVIKQAHALGYFLA